MIDRTKKTFDVARVFFANISAHPGVFMRINTAYPRLAEADQEALSVIVSEPMDEAAANQAMTIIEDAGL